MAHLRLAEIHAEVAAYYAGRLRRHGASPLGVDWTCQPTQELRFVQLLKVVQPRAPFTVNDVGCGYGALLTFMRRRWRAKDFDYLGTDVCAPMVEAARRLHARRRNARFEMAAADLREADYALASGIFNVRLGLAQEAWTRFVQDTLRRLSASSRMGFAVNFLDAEAGVSWPAGLYAAKPATWQRWCEQQTGWRTEVLRGYGLREFTLIGSRRPPP